MEVEIERVLPNLVAQEVGRLFPESVSNGFKPIPQHVVFDWLYSTVVEDPLLKRLESLSPVAEADLTGVDKALWKAKKFKFDEVSGWVDLLKI